MSCPRATYRRYIRALFLGLRSGERLPRDYALEAVCYERAPGRRAKRRSRQALRGSLVRRGVVRRNDGTEVHHRNHDALDNRPSNLVVLSRRDHATLHRLQRVHSHALLAR